MCRSSNTYERMSQTLYVDWHPLGIVVHSKENESELLIEGETCCCMSFEELKRIAASGGKVEIDDATAATCRVLNPAP